MRPLFASKPIEPDVQTNLSGTNGRVYLIVLDDLHTQPLRSTRVKAAARQFVERYMGANDMAAVVHTSGRADAVAGVHEQPAAAVERDRQVHGPQGPLLADGAHRSRSR